MNIKTADIIGYNGKELILSPHDDLNDEIIKKQVSEIEIRLNDGRNISVVQRKKIFAIIADIAEWCGHFPEEVRETLTWDFRALYEVEDFSFSDVDMTTARDYITYLIEFCFYHNVPTKKPLINRSDDIYQYLYLCLKYRKCAVCNKAHAEIHHVNRVGMGRNRDKINNLGLEAIALCHEHHILTETQEKKLFEDNHIYGIPLDEYLCKRLNLNYW